MQSWRVAGGEADAAITTTMSDGQMALRGLIEGKNEIGAGGRDPNLQGALIYEILDGVQSLGSAACAWYASA